MEDYKAALESIAQNVLMGSAVLQIRRIWVQLYPWLFWLAFMLLTSGCASTNAKFKAIVRSTIVEITEIVVIVSLAVAILFPMTNYFIRIVVIGLFEENWQLSSLSVAIDNSTIGSIIGVFIVFNSGAIVDAVISTMKLSHWARLQGISYLTA